LSQLPELPCRWKINPVICSGRTRNVIIELLVDLQNEKNSQAENEGIIYSWHGVGAYAKTTNAEMIIASIPNINEFSWQC
jgi:hypothetical protein